MQTMNKTKDVFLTKAQFEARKTAGTLEEGIIYHTTDETVLTPNGDKTLFGKSILKEPEDNNIDLYRHQLTLTNMNGKSALLIVISSNNLKCASVQDLKSITKATSDYMAYGIDISSGQNANKAVMIAYSSGNFIIQGESINIGPVTAVRDIVTPI